MSTNVARLVRALFTTLAIAGEVGVLIWATTSPQGATAAIAYTVGLALGLASK